MPRAGPRHALPALALAIAALAACAATAPAPRTPRVAGAASDRVASNVTRADYAGSRACAGCHPDVVAAWERSPMHRMTRLADGAEVRAPFDGARFVFKDDVAILETVGGARQVRITSGGTTRTYRVTRVLGGRTREDFVGVEQGGSAEEVVLPVTYSFADRALRYKGYSVMLHERATLRAGPAWSKTCVFCHNTIPEIDRLAGALAGKGARPYQGEQVDALLPPERRRRLAVTDAAAFVRAAEAEEARLGSPAPGGPVDARGAARHLVDVVRDRFDGGALVEVGIGCEACHGGAAEHARDPSRRPSFDERAPWLDVATPGASPAASVDRVCARCHQVLFSKYPFTWEGGRRDLAPGGSHIVSGEARDLLLGGCSGVLSCTACHDPHAADRPEALAALATPAGNHVCTGCHAKLAAPGALAGHAHHDPAGPGGACLACHMARKNMGLDGRLTRYHRVGSPTDPARVLGDRPLECALCHADRSARWLVDAMEKRWRVAYPRQRIEELYGALDANVMRATLERGKPHEQAVALGVLGEARAKDAIPLFERALESEYPLVRLWAEHALESVGVRAKAAARGQGIDEDAED